MLVWIFVLFECCSMYIIFEFIFYLDFFLFLLFIDYWFRLKIFVTNWMWDHYVISYFKMFQFYWMQIEVHCFWFKEKLLELIRSKSKYIIFTYIIYNRWGGSIYKKNHFHVTNPLIFLKKKKTLGKSGFWYKKINKTFRNVWRKYSKMLRIVEMCVGYNKKKM